MNLVGLHEVGQMLGVSRQRADQLARQVGFPKPVDTIKAGRIWRRADVQRWQDARQERADYKLQVEWQRDAEASR